MTNLFKKLVFTDKAIDDLTVAVQAGKSITVERAVLSGWTPPDDDQVYTPYKNSSGALDVAAVKANINKYFDKTEALKNTAPAWVEGILKSKAVKQENENTLNFALDFENTDFDHDVAAKYYGYTSWAELLDNMSEFNIDAQSVALLAQDDTGLEYVFAFAKIESDDSLKYPAALTTELTHKLHIDLFINITQSDNVVINYTPEGCVEYNVFAQHVEQAATIYAKKVDVYDKTAADGRFVRGAKVNDGPTVTPNSDGTLELNVPDPDLSNYATKDDINKKANSSDVYDKTTADGRFARSATINGGTKVTPNSSGNLDLTVDLNNYATKDDINKKANSSDVYDKTAADGRFVRGAKVNDGPTVTPNSDGTLELNVPDPDLSNYATKEDVNKKANTSDVYDKTAADGRFVRGAKVNDGPTVTPNSDGTLELNVPDPDLSNYYNKGEVDEKVNNAGKVKTVNNVSPDTSGNVTVDVGVKKVNNTFPDTSGNVATIQIFDTNAEARDYSAKHPGVLTGVLL